MKIDLSIVYPIRSYVRVATVREKVREKKIQDHGKVREFCYKSVKKSFFEKVRENQSWSGNFYLFIFFFTFVLKSIFLKLGDQDENIE